MANSSKTEALRAMREANYARKNSGGVVEGHEAGVVPAKPVHGIRWGIGSETRHNGSQAGVETCPPERKSKKGRPRLGEVRDKPWLSAKPPMSERTWYRRKNEALRAKEGK